MTSNTLDDVHRAILEGLRSGPAGEDDLAARCSLSTGTLRDRLSKLIDNGLVRREGDRYALTDDGARLLAATGTGADDDRIDTPERVERAISSLRLRPDREAAVRGAFAFLREWGDATGAELVDAIYPEHPVGEPDVRTWWEGVSGALATLPDVAPPPVPASLDGRWPHLGRSNADRPNGIGLAAPRGPTSAGRYASARHAIEVLARTPAESESARAAFATLVERNSASETVLSRSLGGTGTWTPGVRNALLAVPGVTFDGTRWSYVPADGSSR